jgi:hypothetical protein
MDSSNHPIRSGQYIRRNGPANLFRGLQIDHQLELRRLLVSIPFFLDLVSEPQIA